MRKVFFLEKQNNWLLLYISKLTRTPFRVLKENLREICKKIKTSRQSAKKHNVKSS